MSKKRKTTAVNREAEQRRQSHLAEINREVSKLEHSVKTAEGHQKTVIRLKLEELEFERKKTRKSFKGHFNGRVADPAEKATFVQGGAPGLKR